MSWIRRLPLVGLTIAAFALPASGAAAAGLPLALGVNMANAPGSLPTMQSFASMSGANPSLVMWYQQWSEPLFYSTQLPNTQALGAIPLITWDPIIKGVGIPLAQIASGSYDSYITQSADAARGWKGPILIRFAHEMNIDAGGYGPGQNGNTAADFIAAWRHVVTIFRQQGATNVEWVWSPNVDCAGKCPFTSLYPGDAWVDWVALDGYNYSSVDNVPWMTFDQIFKASYAAMTAMTEKPMMIGEMASAEAGGSKAQWITQTFADIAQNYPQIHAVVWFNRVKETDWTVNSSPGSLAAWQAVVASPAYQGTAATLLEQTPLAMDVDSQIPSAPASTNTPAPPGSLTNPTVPPSGFTTTVTPPGTPASPGEVGSISPSSSSVPSAAPTASPAPNPGSSAPASTGQTQAQRIRTALAESLHYLIRRSGGLSHFALALDMNEARISFTPPAGGELAITVYLEEPHPHRGNSRKVVVAATRRALHRAEHTALRVTPTGRGRRILRRDSGRTIIVRVCFIPSSASRGATPETVVTGTLRR